MNKKGGFSQFLSENMGFIYIIPWLIGFLLFKVYPFGSSLEIGRASCRERV